MRLIKRTVAFFIDYMIFVIPASVILISLEFNGLINIYIALSIFSTTYALLLCRDIVGGQSIGKRIMKLRVIDNKSSRRPRAWQHIVRSVFIPLWVVELIMLGINSRQRIGDYVANTRVTACSKEWKNRSKIGGTHFFIFISVALALYFLFLFLFLNTKAFRLYYM